jgi:hypothetical protein
MKCSNASAFAIVSALGLGASTALASVSYVVDDFSTDGYFTGLLSLPGATPFDSRDSLRSGDLPGLAPQRHVVMGLSGGPDSAISGIAAGSIDGGILHLGAGITMSGSEPNRNISASVAASYAAASTLDFTQAISANLVGSTYFNRTGATYIALSLFDQSARIRSYEFSTIGPAGFVNAALDLTTPVISEPGFDASQVLSFRLVIGAGLDPFNSNGNTTAEFTVDIDTFSLTFVPSPSTAAVGALSVGWALRRGRRGDRVVRG